MRGWRAGALVAALAVAPVLAAAQAPTRPAFSSTRDAFLAGAAEAAARYVDRREAIADGFRRLGPDFPGMGVHWVQPGRIVSGAFVGEMPSVLCYVDIDGRPILVSLAYTLPLSSDESPPEEPFGADVWHDHRGEVTEESLLLDHPSSVTSTDANFRLSMLHVWLPLENPDGILVQNNWRLPFLRAGLEPPRHPTQLAARGLSLGGPGLEYYRELLHWATPAGGSDRARIDAALADAAAEIDIWIERHGSGASAGALAELEAVWHRLWGNLERSLSPETYDRIRPLRSGH